MSTTDVTVARIYLHEGKAIRHKIMQQLEGNVRGMIVFRGIAGMMSIN